MKTVKISLKSIDKVKSFVNDLAKFDADFDLVSGRYVIDAKSIMGIFSLIPDADYNSFGIDSHNFKLKFEQFYQPEFDRLGHQPLNTIKGRKT